MTPGRFSKAYVDSRITEECGYTRKNHKPKKSRVGGIEKGYDSKLHEINKYIRILQEQEGIKVDGEIPEEILRQKINNVIKCSKCDHEVWNINSDNEFIIIPKQKLQYLLGKESDKRLLDGLGELTLQKDSVTDTNSRYDQVLRDIQVLKGIRSNIILSRRKYVRTVPNQVILEHIV